MPVPSALSSAIVDHSITYACERCKVERSLAPARQSPGRVRRLRIRLAALWQGGLEGETRSVTVARLKQEYLANAEEAAYGKFTGSFRFCHECRRFVCPKCWNLTWHTCKSCVERAMKKMSPRRRRYHYGLSFAVIGASLMLLVLGIGSVLANGAAAH